MVGVNFWYPTARRPYFMIDCVLSITTIEDLEVSLQIMVMIRR